MVINYINIGGLFHAAYHLKILFEVVICCGYIFYKCVCGEYSLIELFSRVHRHSGINFSGAV
ncbi:MAG: hypothetical protein QG632_898 [Candidatus Dependentiae bacterium]|nr:hypothetical protein [Candidatus Dependentiae bacterium]